MSLIWLQITEKNWSKILTKHVPCKGECKFNGRKCNSNQKWNNDKCQPECKNIIHVKKIIFGILLHVFAETVSI